MYKILIADDKALIRKGLIKMINWKELNAEPAGEAENGITALRLIEEKKPDIIITDIRMPELDGLGLLEEINDRKLAIQIVVISGYDDFEYVKQAMKNGSLDYILKPVDPVELNTSLRKACEIINRKRIVNDLFDQEKQTSLHIYNLVHGLQNSEADYRGELCEIVSSCNLFCAVVIRAVDDRIDLSDMYSSIRKFCGFAKIFVIDDIRECLIVFCKDWSSDEMLFQNMIYYTLLKEFNRDYMCDLNIAAGIGKTVKSMDIIADSYESAFKALLYSLISEGKKIIPQKDISYRKNYTLPSEEFENDLVVSVASGSFRAASASLDKIFSLISEMKDLSLDSYKLNVSRLCHILLKLDTGLSDDIYEFLNKLNNPEYLWRFKSITNIRQIVYNFYEFVSRKYLEEQGGRDSSILRIKKFIEKNYAAEIGLEQISEIFHMNASYLSRLFKQETGENLSGYITRVRIENAKRILGAGDIKIPQLAHMMGYIDQTYFYKVFKKVTGMTPKEFQVEVEKSPSKKVTIK